MIFLPGAGFVCVDCRSKRFSTYHATSTKSSGAIEVSSSEPVLNGPWAPESWNGRPRVEFKASKRRNDWKFWRRVLVLRRRIDGDEGVRAVWEAIKQHGVELPAEENMWRIFCEVAANDQMMLNEILHTAVAWDGVYDTIMRKVHAQRAWYVHRRLYSRFSSRDWGKLVAARPDLGLELREIVPRIGKGCYKAILDNVEGAEALAWHRALLRNGHIPESAEEVQKIVEYLAARAPWTEFRHGIKEIAKTGVKLGESAAVAVLRHRPCLKEALELIFEDNTFKSAFHDDFWSQMFNTTLQPVDVFRYMLFFGDGSVVADKTVNCVMLKLRKDAAESAIMLNLAGLQVRPSQVVDSQLKPEPPSQDNLSRVLENHIQNRNIPKAIKMLSIIRKAAKPVDPEILRRLAYILLLPRKYGMNPSVRHRHWFEHGEDIDAVTTLHLKLKSEGYQIVPWTWLEVIKRLGKTKRIDDLEKLLLRIVAVYETEGAPKRGPGYPFRDIFEAVTLRAIIEWGFLYGRGVWGVKVVRKMKEGGVWVEGKTIKRAVRLALRGQKEEAVRYWRKEAEAAWGEKLWENDERVDDIRERGRSLSRRREM